MRGNGRPVLPAEGAIRKAFDQARQGGRSEPLNLIVEIKGFRGEDAKEKANTMRAYWVLGVDNLERCGRSAFAEFTVVYEIEAEFNKRIAAQCERAGADVVDHGV